MNTRTLLVVGALLAAAAAPATLHAQRRSRHHVSPRTSYGHGPFYPSYIPGPSFNYYGPGAYRAGGATFYFGPGGGYYGTVPSWGYGVPYGGYGYGYPYRGSYWTPNRNRLNGRTHGRLGPRNSGHRR